MKSLDQIGREQYTEKADQGFLKIYDKLWTPIRYDPIKLLEIGVYNGNSMRTWCEYFPNATIVGIEKNDANPMSVDRAEVWFGNQSDIDFLQKVIEEYGDFDIIVDDGGHIWAEQLASFIYLIHFVKPGGMYIIEDLQTSFDRFWQKENEISMLEYLKNTVNTVMINPEQIIESVEFYYRVAIIHKRA